MFVLIRRTDSIPIDPSLFDQNLHAVLRRLIDVKYANKVLQDVGLCVCLYEIESIGDGHFVSDSGSSYTECTFRLVVFRPFVGETLVGKIWKQSPEGIYITLDFFLDVTIPASLLQQPSTWNPETQEWVWQYDDQQLPMYIKEDVSFKVHKIRYATIKENARRRVATIKESAEDAQSGAAGAAMMLSRSRLRSRSMSMDVAEDDAPPPIMTIVGRCNESGLGMCAWWEDAVEEEEGDEEGEEEEEGAGGGVEEEDA